MDFCIYKKPCAYKLDCNNSNDIGLCDYYGQYVRTVKPNTYIFRIECKYLSLMPTEEHIKLCESCRGRFYCWSHQYVEDDHPFSIFPPYRIRITTAKNSNLL